MNNIMTTMRNIITRTEENPAARILISANKDSEHISLKQGDNLITIDCDKITFLISAFKRSYDNVHITDK